MAGHSVKLTQPRRDALGSPGRHPRAAPILICAAVFAAFASQYWHLLRPGYTLCFCDVRLQYIPWLYWIQTHLHRGSFPLIAPTGAGYPLYADPQAMTFYLPAFVFGFLPILPAVQALIVGHLLIATAGCYVLGRHLRLGVLPALLIGLLWIGNGFVYHFDYQLTVACALAWWPWLLWALLRLDERADVTRILTVVAFGIIEVLVGHPQMASYFALLWLGWLVAGPLRQRGRTAVASAAVAVVVVSLTAFAWLPWRMLGQQSGRAAPTQEFVSEGSIPLAHLPGIVLPRIYGGDSSVFYGLYFGMAGLALALAGAWDRRRFRLALLALVALSVTWGEGNPLHQAMLHLPVLNQFRYPHRYLTIAFMLWAILAGYGVARLDRRRWLQLGIVALIAFDLGYVNPERGPDAAPTNAQMSFSQYMKESVEVRALKSRPPGAFFLYMNYNRGIKGLFDPPLRLMANESLLWELPCLQAFTPLAPLRQAQFEDRYGGAYQGGVPNRPAVPGRLTMLRRLGCRYIVSTAPLGELEAYPTTRLPNGIVIYDMGIPPFALLRRGSVLHSAEGGESWWEIEGTFAHAQPVVFAIGYWPELRAWVDGRPVPVVPWGPNPMVEVPSGEHRVRIEYVPTSLYHGMAVSAAALVLFVGLAVVMRRRIFARYRRPCCDRA